ncbi:MAG: response regulator transcription factor [Lachnospiraceae bacterium]|nr:response regulator transcription factor [Lachnospiraceae bacterium]
MGRKILVVDDEMNIVNILAFNLKKEGYEVITAFDGAEGIKKAYEQEPDLILLDVMMPIIDGYEACRKIRERFQTPIIMLTAKAEEVDKVLGLELGADDYVTKPFSVRELMARVKANLRRSAAVMPAVTEEVKPAEPENPNIMKFGTLTIDTSLYEVRKSGELIDLTLREYELLKFLAENNTQVFSREALLEKVWGYEFPGDVRTVDVTVRRLREKVEDNPAKPAYIITKRGVGYHFGA